MNSEEFFQMLEIQADGMQRDGPNGLFFFTDIAQQALKRTAGEQNIPFNPATGRLYVLNTTQGVFEYEAPDDAWRIGGIVAEANVSAPLIQNLYYEDYGYNVSRDGVDEIQRVYIAGVQYFKIQQVRSYDATESQNARIIFTEDPQTTEDIYRWWYYTKEVRMYSTSIELTIQPPYDYLYLFPAVAALIQGYKDGDYVGALGKIEQLKQLYTKELNRGEQGLSLEAKSRGF